MTRIHNHKQRRWPRFRTLLFFSIIVLLLAGRSIAQTPDDQNYSIDPVDLRPEDKETVGTDIHKTQAQNPDRPEATLSPPPPASNPPPTPQDNPPVDNPPQDNPPADNPPTDNSPQENPPADNPPQDNPPAENPPQDNPPQANPSDNPPQNPPDNPPDNPPQNPPDNPPDNLPPANDTHIDDHPEVKEDGDRLPVADDKPEDGDDNVPLGDGDKPETDDNDVENDYGDNEEDYKDDDKDKEEDKDEDKKKPPPAHIPLKTEPLFWHSRMNISIADYDRMAPGHIFLSPTSPKGTPGWQGYGPQIYDVYGNMIWYGNDTTSNRCMRAHVCDYLGEKGNHICFHDGRLVTVAFNKGVIRFLDNTYTEVFTSNATNGLAQPDIHEINTPRGTDGQILLQDVYNVTRSSFIDEDGSIRKGWLANICFQEIDIKTKEVNFQWCAHEHMPMRHKHYEPKANETNLRPIVVWGGRGSKNLPWDFYHINGVDRTSEGDYLISLRHQSSIVKIAGRSGKNGKPGEIIWVLKNGKPSDWEKDFTFSFQHAVRSVSVGPEKEVISFMDNGSAGSSEWSFGKIIELYNKTMEAKLLRKFPEPDFKRGNTAGSMQTFPESGNALMGWGSRPFFSEYTDDGTCVFHARISTGHSPQVWKAPWKGYPKQKPKVLAYKMNCAYDSPVHIYTSWNGATEVKTWAVWYGNGLHGPWTDGGIWNKTGFETNATFSHIGFPPWVYAEALDANGDILAKTDPTQTFVPNITTVQNCTTWGCDDLLQFEYRQEWSAAGQCPHPISWRDIPLILQIPVIIGFLCAVQWIVWMWEAFFAPGFAGFGYFARNARGQYVTISGEGDGYKDAPDYDEPETPTAEYANGNGYSYAKEDIEKG